MSPKRFPTTAGDLAVTVTGVNFDRVEWSFADPSYRQISVVSTSEDGTSAQLRLFSDLEGPDWVDGNLSGTARLRGSYTTPCAQATCRVASTPAAAIEFYAPTTAVPGFPSAPTGLSATRGASSVVLTWDANPAAEDVVDYELFRNGRKIANARTGLTYTVSPVVQTTERFSIRADARYGNRSQLSQEILVAGDGPPDTIAPKAPTGLSVTRASDPLGASVTWNPSNETGDQAVAGWEIFLDGKKVATQSTPALGVGNIVPSRPHYFAARAYDRAGNLSPLSAEVTLAAIPCDTDCEPPEPVVGYALKGSATLRTLVKGSVPLSGALTGLTLDETTGAFGGDLTLAKSTAKLTALGFLPVTAQVAFVPTEPVSGTLTGGALAATAKVRIKLPKLTLFGLELAGGANCQAKQVTSVPLKSTGTFTAAAAGSLTGTFAISDLTGCGALTGIVSPLTAGKGNAIALSLTPAP